MNCWPDEEAKSSKSEAILAYSNNLINHQIQIFKCEFEFLNLNDSIIFLYFSVTPPPFQISENLQGFETPHNSSDTINCFLLKLFWIQNLIRTSVRLIPRLELNLSDAFLCHGPASLIICLADLTAFSYELAVFWKRQIYAHGSPSQISQ